MIYLETKSSDGRTDFVIELDGLDEEAQTLTGLRYTDQYNNHAWIEATSIISVEYSSGWNKWDIKAYMPDGNAYLFEFYNFDEREDLDGVYSYFRITISNLPDDTAEGYQIYYFGRAGYGTALPEMTDGYFPTFVVPELADDYVAGNGNHHTHVLNGKTYYMPEGLVLGSTSWHGDYPSYVAPGSGVSVAIQRITSGTGWYGAQVYIYESLTGLVAVNFGCDDNQNGSIITAELKDGVEYVWDVKYGSISLSGGGFVMTRLDANEEVININLAGTIGTLIGTFTLVEYVDGFDLLSMSASVIDGTSATITSAWNPYTTSNAASWAVTGNNEFGAVGSAWSGVSFAFGSDGVVNFPSSGVQSVQVAALDGSGNILYISSSISVDTEVITLTVVSQDSWGDGWTGTRLDIYDSGGSVAGTYTLVSGSGETAQLVLPSGDYTWALVTPGSWNYPDETSVTVTATDGSVLLSWAGGTPSSGSFTLASHSGSGGSGDGGDSGAPGDGVDEGSSGGSFSFQEIMTNSIPDYTLMTVGLDGHVDYFIQLLDWESDEADYLFYIRKGDNTYLAMESWSPTSPTADWATHSIVIQESADNFTYIDFTDPSQAQGFMLAEVWVNGSVASNSSKLTWMTQESLFNMSGHYFQTYIAPTEAPTLEGLTANVEGWSYNSTETAFSVYSEHPYKVHFADDSYENLLQPQAMPYTGRNSFLTEGKGGMWVEGTVAGQSVTVSGRYSGPVFIDDALDSDTGIDKMVWGSTEYSLVHHSATVSGQDMMSFTKYGDCYVQIFEGDIIKFDYDVQIVGNQIEVTPPAGKDGTGITVRVMNEI